MRLINYRNGKQHYPDKEHRNHKAYDEVAPMYHSRYRKYRIMAYSSKTREFEATASVVDLLCVNKRSPKKLFPFLSVSTLGRLLRAISPDMKQNLRHIKSADFLCSNGLTEARDTLLALAEAKNIRTFGISHRQICSEPLSIDGLVAMCEPLLNSLKISYAAQNLTFSSPDVFFITLPTSNAREELKKVEDGIVGKDVFLCGRYARSACNCRVAELEQNNHELTKQLRKRVASLLELADT